MIPEPLQRSAVLSWRRLLQVSSRKVLQAVLERHAVPTDLFGPVCVVVDKIEKIKSERVPTRPCSSLPTALPPHLATIFGCAALRFACVLYS